MASVIAVLKANGGKVVLVSAPVATALSTSADSHDVQQPNYDTLAMANAVLADAVLIYAAAGLGDPTVNRIDGPHNNIAANALLAAALKPLVVGMLPVTAIDRPIRPLGHVLVSGGLVQ
jgi:hypothetical protein